MKDFFDMKKEEKITEKAFSQGLLISVLGILLCMIALCSMTFAWFTGETKSENNILQSGSFDVEASVIRVENGVPVGDKITVTREANGVMHCTLEKIGTYEVTLAMSPNATVKGFCGISVNGGEKMLTASISDDPEVGVNPLRFTIETTEEDTTLVITSQWGYPASPTITQDFKITLNDGEIDSEEINLASE